MENHISQNCMIHSCAQQAGYWIEDIALTSTFYICSDCKSKIQNENEEYIFITVIGEITTREIARYSCHDECTECEEI